jgi:hypothetical protein
VCGETRISTEEFAAQTQTLPIISSPRYSFEIDEMQAVARVLGRCDREDVMAMALELIDAADVLGFIEKPLALEALFLMVWIFDVQLRSCSTRFESGEHTTTLKIKDHVGVQTRTVHRTGTATRTARATRTAVPTRRNRQTAMKADKINNSSKYNNNK